MYLWPNLWLTHYIYFSENIFIALNNYILVCSWNIKRSMSDKQRERMSGKNQWINMKFHTKCYASQSPSSFFYIFLQVLILISYDIVKLKTFSRAFSELLIFNVQCLIVFISLILKWKINEKLQINCHNLYVKK